MPLMLIVPFFICKKNCRVIISMIRSLPFTEQSGTKKKKRITQHQPTKAENKQKKKFKTALSLNPSHLLSKIKINFLLRQ